MVCFMKSLSSESVKKPCAIVVPLRTFAIDVNPLEVLCGLREPINAVLSKAEPFRQGNF